MKKAGLLSYFTNLFWGNSAKKEILLIRLFIVTGLVCLIGFVLIYFQPENRGYFWLYGLLTISVVFKVLRVLHEWYHYWKVVPATPPPLSRTWTVDVLTTFCPGEPYEMILNTLKAIQAIRYPHTTYLCDEANDPYLRQVCEEMGVIHVTRVVKKDAKAGNINNALQQATGEICLILDPDHVPVPDFLDQVLPYFEDPDIGFVQCVQAYYNRKESLVAYGAAEQTYNFYGPMMICMSNYGTAQAIGANCTFRRAALDSIGGHAAGLSEDMHTAMQLHAQNWKSVYVPKPLSYGLVPATMAAFYKQQLKWARGTFELLLVTLPQVFRRLSWRQRIHYFTVPLYYLIGIVQLIDLLIPIFALIFMRLPLRLDLMVFALAYVPLLFMMFIIRQYAQRWFIENHEVGFHLIGGILTSGTWWIYVLGFIYTLFRIDVPYLPTPKNDRPRNNFLLCLPNLIFIVATLGAIGYSVYYYGLLSVGNRYVQFMIVFGLINVFILSINVVIGQEKILFTFRKKLKTQLINPSERWIKWLWIWRLRYSIYGWVRASAKPLYAVMVVLALGMAGYTFHQSFSVEPGDLRYGTTQTFYVGDQPVPLSSNAWPARPRSPIHLQHLHWPTNAAGNISRPVLNPQIQEIPLLFLEPDLSASSTDSAKRQFLKNIRLGKEDDRLNRFLQDIQHYKRPVLVAFAPYFDDRSQPWGTRKGSLLIEYQQVFQYLAHFCRAKTANSIIWVWCPTQATTISFYYPGYDCVDWIGLKVENDPDRSVDRESHSFSALYQPLRNSIIRHEIYSLRHKPILITEMKSATSGENHHWQTLALQHIRERYPEIRGILLN